MNVHEIAEECASWYLTLHNNNNNNSNNIIKNISNDDDDKQGNEIDCKSNNSNGYDNKAQSLVSSFSSSSSLFDLVRMNIHVRHSENVETKLRKIVEFWTYTILVLPHSNNDWKDDFLSFLKQTNGTSSCTTTSMNNNEDETSHPLLLFPSSSSSSLSRSSLARMEAFLAGCALAVPDNPIRTTESSSSSSNNNNNTTTASSNTTTTTTTNPLLRSNHHPRTLSSLISSSARSYYSSFFKGSILNVIQPNDNNNNNHNTHHTKESQQRNNHDNQKKHTAHHSIPTTTTKTTTTNNNNNMTPIQQKTKAAALLPQQQQQQHKPQMCKYPQFHKKDLSLRLELYLRSLRRIKAHSINNRNQQMECGLALEPRKALKARVDLLVQSFVATVGCVHSIRPTLTKLLLHLTKELLAVTHLSEHIQFVSLNKVVQQYEHLTSFASLAFLSTPECASPQLHNLVYQYITYLASDTQHHVQSCHLEHMLATTIPPHIRHIFKTVEFNSIGHLLATCKTHSAILESIQLPSLKQQTNHNHDNNNNNDNHNSILCLNDKKKLKQAMRDLRREVITVNSHVLPPVTSYKELLRVLTEILNSRTITLREHNHSNTNRSSSSSRSSNNKTRNHHHHHLMRNNNNHHSHPNNNAANTTTTTTSASSRNCKLNGDREFESEKSSDDILLSSGNEGDTDGTINSGNNSQPNHHPNKSSKSSTSPRGVGSGGRRKFSVDAIDVLTRRLLLAASRTGSGGDSFFVVRDLFGGDEVDVVQSSSIPTTYSPYTTTTTTTDHNNNNNNSYYHHTNSGIRRMPRRGTVELIVRLASVTIKCNSRYDVYPKSSSSTNTTTNTNNEVSSLFFDQPLITLHTTTTENIYLQEVRVNEHGMQLSSSSSSNTDTIQNNNNYNKPSMIMLKEKETPMSGTRILSIRPAKYEKILDYHTPS